MSQLKELERIANGVRKADEKNPFTDSSPETITESKKCSATLQTVVNRQRASTPLTPPATAFSLFG